MDESVVVPPPAPSNVTPVQAAPAEPPPTLPTAPKKRMSPLIFIIPVFFLMLGVELYVYKQVTTPLSEIVQVLPAPSPNLFLTLTSPNESTAAVNGEVYVSGMTVPNTSVAIYTDTDDTIVDSNAEGKFEGSVLVGESGGLVRVTAFGKTGDAVESMFNLSDNSLSYTGPDVLGKTTAPGKQNNGNNDNNANNGNKNYNVDSVNAASAPVLNPRGKQNNPPGNKENIFVQDTSTTSDNSKKLIKDFLGKKTESPKPNKLGADKIKALLSREGTASGTLAPGKLKKLEVQTATRGAQLKRHAAAGVVTAVTGGTITLAQMVHRDQTIQIFMNIDTVVTGKGEASGSAITVGTRIAVVGTPVDGGLLATRIHIIPGRATGLFNKFPVATAGGEITSPTPISTESASPTPSETPVITGTPAETPTETPIPPTATPTP